MLCLCYWDEKYETDVVFLKRYGCRLVSFGDLGMVNFFIAFLGVYFSGQQASILFDFSSSGCPN